MKVPVYILAGGKSSRFGSDKARAIFQGKPLLLHVAALLQPIASSITVVADRTGKYQDLGLTTLEDIHLARGPLAGLHTALTHLPAQCPWLLLCSCDIVIFKSTWLQTLVSACDNNHDAIAFRNDYWQPMPALYAPSSLHTVSDFLQSDQRSLQYLLNHVSTLALPLPVDWQEYRQANTAQELNSANE